MNVDGTKLVHNWASSVMFCLKFLGVITSFFWDNEAVVGDTVTPSKDY